MPVKRNTAKRKAGTKKHKKVVVRKKKSWLHKLLLNLFCITKLPSKNKKQKTTNRKKAVRKTATKKRVSHRKTARVSSRRKTSNRRAA